MNKDFAKINTLFSDTGTNLILIVIEVSDCYGFQL